MVIFGSARSITGSIISYRVKTKQLVSALCITLHFHRARFLLSLNLPSSIANN